MQAKCSVHVLVCLSMKNKERVTTNTNVQFKQNIHFRKMLIVYCL